MKSKKSSNCYLGPDTEIKEIDKILKDLDRMPKSPEVVRHTIGLQMRRAKLRTELARQSRQ